jgi:pimeloyl-ACP methyl ester carboxylesterase
VECERLVEPGDRGGGFSQGQGDGRSVADRCCCSVSNMRLPRPPGFGRETAARLARPNRSQSTCYAYPDVYHQPGAILPRCGFGSVLRFQSPGREGLSVINAFAEADHTDDLKAISVPTLLMQGDDDQVVPYKDAAAVQARLIKNSTLKIYPSYPHGMLTIHAGVINLALVAFINS